MLEKCFKKKYVRKKLCVLCELRVKQKFSQK